MWSLRQQQWLLRQLSQHRLFPSSFRRVLSGLRPLSTATPRPGRRPPAEPAHFMVDYLVDSCGLSRTDAAKASKHLAHLKSPEKPDAVLCLLKETGLCVAHIRRLVLSFPMVLVAHAGKTLEPKIRALQEVGFSKPELAQLISVNPNAIRRRDAVPKIESWRKIVGSNEKLLKIAKNVRFLGYNMDWKANPNLSFLRSVGLSDADIVKFVVRRPRIISTTLSKVMSIVKRVMSLGITPVSGVFWRVLVVISDLSETTVATKSKLLRSYGWSEVELLFALRTCPEILTSSEKRIGRSMDFLLKEAGCQPSYVARRPQLLTYSIDKRLIPRYYVLQFLKKKGLLRRDVDLFSAVVFPENKFVDKFIAPIREDASELLETYPEVSYLKLILKLVR